MKRFVGLRTVLTLAATLFAVSTGAQQQFITEYRLDREAVEIPFEYSDHQIMVRVQVNDKKNLRFLFDSGATSLVLNKELGITGTHLADTQFHEAEGVTKAEAIALGDLTLGEKGTQINVHNVAALLADLSQMSKLLGKHIDGIIGVNVMIGYIVEINYQKKVLQFYNARTFSVAPRRPDNEKTFLIDLHPANLIAPVSVMLTTGQLHAKYDYDFLIDTGFGGFASIANTSAQEAGLLKNDTPRIVSTAFTLTRQYSTSKIRADYLRFGSLDLTGRTVQIDFRNNDAYGQFGILGNRMLQNFRVTLDFAHRKLWLERVIAPEKEEPDDSDHPSLGIAIRGTGFSFVVESVKPNSPAQRGGVRPGDVILSINGQAVDTMNAAQVANLLTSPRSDVTLNLNRGVDPNFGTRGGPLTLTLKPSSPLDWRPQ